MFKKSEMLKKYTGNLNMDIKIKVLYKIQTLLWPVSQETPISIYYITICSKYNLTQYLLCNLSERYGIYFCWITVLCTSIFKKMLIL